MGDLGERFNAAVAAELRAQRARQQITIDTVVQGSGISKSAVLNYMNGKRDIPTSALIEICRVLDVSPRLIFEHAEHAIQQN